MTRRTKAAGSRRRGRLLLLLGGTVVGLLLGEIGARVLGYVRDRKVRDDWARLAARAAPAPDQVLHTDNLGDLVRISEDPDIVYEFIPNLRAHYQGADCAFNAHGFRDAPWPAEARRPDTLRIVALGDSVLFGWGVEFESTWLQVLRRRVAAALPGVEVEVMNTGVPGYNTAMEVATFAGKMQRFRPDVVLIDWVGNDADLPNLIARDRSPFDLDGSYLLDLCLQLLGKREQFPDTPLRRTPFSPSQQHERPEDLPPRYRDMVGEAGVERALRRLAALSREQGFTLLMACHFDAPAFVERICREQGIPLAAGGNRIRAHLGAAIGDYLESELVLDGDPHPSARGHALYAETLFEHLAQNGVLSR